MALFRLSDINNLEATCDHSASEADTVLGIIEHSILSWCNALDGLFALDEVARSRVIAQPSTGEVGGVTHLEGDLEDLLSRWGGLYTTLVCRVLPRVATDEVAGLHTYVVTVLVGRVVALADQDDVATDVLLHHKPRPSTQP